MRPNDPTILITREIDESLLNELASNGITADVIPFIHTEIIRERKVQAQIENVLKLQTTVVFTSINAVEAVSEHLHNKKPNWKIYCTGNTTRLSVEKSFGKESVSATAEDATVLAGKIIADKLTSEVYFFCGDKKRNELPGLLKENNIRVTEIEVYRTTINHHKAEKEYDAILFFSPSAVNGFFENNSIKEKTVLFAIGNTTAEEIKKFAENEIVVSDMPGKKELIEKMILFFES